MLVPHRGTSICFLVPQPGGKGTLLLFLMLASIDYLPAIDRHIVYVDSDLSAGAKSIDLQVR